ncbi:MAG TPA: GGDEF domain-containing protein [Azospirillaceae bacterium]|nr:GGDEF domain-containing protein [Azospirillaceae bacterium]
MTPANTASILPRLDRDLSAAGLQASLRTAEPASGGLNHFMLQEMALRLADAERVISEQRERIEALETMTMTDELTGLMNRRGFMDAFRRELAATRRGTATGVLVMVDLDGFKAINDRHGHLAGDAYLRQVGRALTESVRAQDVVARLGGDEFAVLLTRVGEAAGQARAEALAKAFEGRHATWQNVALPLRASFGAMAYRSGDREDEALRRADARMYQVKAERKRPA